MTGSALAQQADRAGSHVFDNARIFTGDAGEQKLRKLERQLADSMLDTGAHLVFGTESVATGSSAKDLAIKYVAEMLDQSKPGAVMVYVRADDSVGVAISGGSGNIPEYVFSTVEKGPSSRPDSIAVAEYAMRSADELIAVFRKYYSPESGKVDPRKHGDKILMISVICGAFLLVFCFAFFAWRLNSTQS